LTQSGITAFINRQSNYKRDTQYIKGKAVDKEHIGVSMLVTLDCSELNQTSRNALFMSNRETFREDPLLNELFKKLQHELKWHEGLIELDRRRYEEKIKNATSDEDGINALEELLTTDPALADLFSSMMQGKVAAKTIAAAISGAKIEGEASKFEGTEFPTYFRRKDGATCVEIELPQNGEARASFLTDVKNNYFTRAKARGRVEFSGELEPTFRLFNGRLTLTFRSGKMKRPVGTVYDTAVSISDSSHGPWKLNIKVTIAPAREKEEHESPEPKLPMTDAAPSRPNIIEVKRGPE